MVLSKMALLVNMSQKSYQLLGQMPSSDPTYVECSAEEYIGLKLAVCPNRRLRTDRAYVDEDDRFVVELCRTTLEQHPEFLLIVFSRTRIGSFQSKVYHYIPPGWKTITKV